MKININSWNFCGLQKFENNATFREYLLNFDIVGLLETWGYRIGQFDSFISNYTCFDSVRIKNDRALRSSGGIAVFVKNYFIECSLITHILPELPDCVVLHIKNSSISDVPDIIVYITYVSPEGSSIYESREYTCGIDYIDSNIFHIKELFPQCLLYIAGDFNARTKTMLDYIPADNLDLIFNMKLDYTADSFEMNRNNMGLQYNNFGKSLVNFCCLHSVHIVNGRLHGDIRGNFTCITHNGASTVDYHLAFSHLFDYITEV